MHVDSFGSHFYMALLHGKKEWTLFSRASVPFLYPTYCPSALDPSFQVDITNPDMEKFPLFSKAERWHCSLEAGDLIFVPSGCPHHVVNTSDTLASDSKSMT
jgi:ribosomal protein L16 Arg81 hydroxylase